MPNRLHKSEIQRARRLIARSRKYKRYSKARKARIAFAVAWKIHRAKKRKR